ncbi:hypothetical protein PR048_020420 [Dryococelus australis]|uniref:Integrase catalytic domain-containing protein n=1 Tax=Dryococelus australis TaxID=614101 RepID=A0ABQ9H692_9NEOP|nr:hypothetical protein PR048_020420 [Dryococelus australis]
MDPPFNSNGFSAYCQDLGIKLIKIAPCNPRSNGLAEREVQTFKKSLIKIALSNIGIYINVNQCLFLLRSTPSSVTGMSPMSLMLNYQTIYLVYMSNPVCIRGNDEESCKKPLNRVLPYLVGDEDGNVHREVTNLNFHLDIAQTLADPVQCGQLNSLLPLVISCCSTNSDCTKLCEAAISIWAKVFH